MTSSDEIRKLRDSPWGDEIEVDTELRRLVSQGPPDIDFDDRIRAAFILLEQRIRVKANLPDHDFGTDLVNKAFGDDGVLQPVSPIKAECIGLRRLLEGAFLYFRNPIAHRPVVHSKQSAWHIFHLVNQLLSLVESAAQSVFSIHDYVGHHEGEILQRRDFRLDIDNDDELEIVILLDVGPKSTQDGLRSFLIPVVIDRIGKSYRRIPSEGVALRSLYGPYKVELHSTTSAVRPDIVASWITGESSITTIILRWANNQYLLVKRDIANLEEPEFEPWEDGFTTHDKHSLQFADIDGDGIVELIQELRFDDADLGRLGYRGGANAEEGQLVVFRILKWDVASQRLSCISQNTVMRGLVRNPNALR